MATCFEQHLKDGLNQEEKREFAATARKEAAKYNLETPDVLSYMNAAGQQLESLISEEFKITSGFSNSFKSSELTPAIERIKIADHVKQGIATFINTGVDLFSFVKTANNKEIYQRFSKFLGKPISEKEQFTIDSFASFIRKEVDKSFSQPWFFPAVLTGKKNLPLAKEISDGYLNADLMNQLTMMEGNKRVTTEAVKLALGFAAYQALFDLDASTKFKTAKDIKRIHGKEPVVHLGTALAVLKNKHLPIGTAINSWGQLAYTALGLSEVTNSSPNMAANLKAALGAQVVQILRDRNILSVESIEGQKYSELFTEPGGSPYAGPDTRFFYTKNTKYDSAKNTKESVNKLIESVINAKKQSGDVISKLFTGTDNTKDILYKPSTKIDNKTDTGMEVPALMKQVQEAVQNNPLVAEKTQANLVISMASEKANDELSFAQALVGIKTTEEISKAHHTQRAGLEGANDALQRGLDVLLQHYNDASEAGVELPVFLKMDVWKMLRAGTSYGAIDPTGQKIHRYSMISEKWIKEVNFGTEEENDFLRRVAEGLNIATDKQANVKTDIDFIDAINKPNIKTAIKAIQEGDNYGGIITALNDIGLKGGERVKTFSALVAYANYLTAKENNQPTFEASLMGEVDGVSNGPMLTLLMLGTTVGGLSMEDMFAKGGFYTDGNKDFNVWKSQGNVDLYEDASRNILFRIANWALKNGGPVLSGLEYFSGTEVEKKTPKNQLIKVIELTTRKSIKEAVNPIMFGSALKKAVGGLFNKFIDGIYTKIASVYNMPAENAEAKKLAIVELNKKLIGLGLIDKVQTVEELHNVFEITPKQEAALWKAYYENKGSIGDVIDKGLGQYFEKFLETKTLITKTSNDAAENYIKAKKVLIEKALKEAGISYQKDAVNVGLSQEVLDGIEKQLMDAGITPVMDSIWSQEENNLNAGLLLLKRFKGQTDDEQYLTKVTGSQSFVTGDNKHLTARSKGPVEAGPGVLGTSVGTHSFDGYVSFTRMQELFKQGVTSFNMHDSGGTVFSNMRQMAIEFNKVTFQGLIKYSPASAIAEMAVRNLEGMSKFDADLNIDFEKQINVAKDLIYAAKEATENKLTFLEKVKNVSQYAYEGGSYEVTAADLKAVAEQKQKEIERHDDLLNRLETLIVNKAIKVKTELKIVLNIVNESVTTEETEAQADIIDDSNVENSTNLLQNKLNNLGLNKEISLDSFLDIVSNSSYGVYSDLAKMLKGTNASVRVINSVAEIKDENTKAAIKKLGDVAGAMYGNTIYIFKSSITDELTEELLVHEAVHAVVTGWLLAPKNKDTDVYKNLNSLYEIAKQENKKQNKDFVKELENIDEFVTYGLSNKEFQQFLGTLKIGENFKDFYTNNAFYNFVKNIAKIFNIVFNKKQDLNNVLLGVINQGATLISLAKKENQVSKEARGMKLANGLNTHSTMEVFDALNAGSLSSDVANHLRGLLSTVVYKLHGPFGSLHSKYMQETPLDAVSVYEGAYKAGELPIATAIATAGLAMSDAEAFAVDQVAIALESGLNNPAMRKYTRVLELLYEQTASKLKPNDFSNGVYDFIFDTANTNQQALVRFAALGLANQEVIAAFNKVNVVLPGVVIKNTLFSKLQWLFTEVLNFLASKTTGVKQNESLDANLEKVIKNLIASEAKYQFIAAKPIKDSVLEKYTKEGLEKVGKGVTAIAKSKAIRNSSIKNIPVVGDSAARALDMAGGIVDATINGRIEAMVEAGMKFRNNLVAGPLGFGAGIVNEMRGETDLKKRFYQILRLVKGTESEREKHIQRTSNLILEMFENNGKDITKDQEKGVSNLLRTGIGISGLTGKQVQELLKDSTKLDKEIDNLINKIKPISKQYTKFLSAKAEATGYWLNTGISADPTRIAMNAIMVIAMQGTPVEGKLTKQKDVLLSDVEMLISLYGLRHMDKSAVVSLIDKEVARGADNGIDFVFKQHQRLHKDAKESLFKGKEIFMQHGYLPEVVDPNVDVKYITATLGKTLEENVYMYQKAGYVSYGLLGKDPAHPEPTVMLVNKNVPSTRRLTALMAVIDDNTKGTLLHDGANAVAQAAANQTLNTRVNKVTELNYVKWEKQGFSFSTEYKNTLMIPLVDEQGNLVNARYMATAKFRDNVLTRNNNFAYLLGKYHGTTYEKLTSKEQNKNIVQATKDLFDNNYKNNERDYYFVGLNTKDKEYQEAYKLLPEETRKEIKAIWGTDGMFVRKDMLDLVFGYRKLTVGDAMLNNKAEQNAVIKGMVSLVEHVYAHNGTTEEKYAAKLKAANFMKQLQRGTEEVVTELKKTIVMRIPVVLFGNETSNVSMLKLKGMGVFEALQEKGKALSALNVYRTQSEELDKLNTYLITGTRINEHPAFIKRVAWLEESMNRNPVKFLIDAGFMPTIVEDVETIAEDYSYKGDLLNRVDAITNKYKPLKSGSNVGNQLFMGEDTGMFQFMRYATQASDFTARYALFVHLSKDKTKTKEDIFREISEAFINYDAPSHRTMEALNSVGLLMFTKFVLRVQKPLFEAVKANPSNAMQLWLFNYFFDGLSLITEASFLDRFYNPLKLGPIEYPFVINDIGTIDAITSGVGALVPGK